MLTEPDIKAIISQTYAGVALQLDTDMRLVADVFEVVRKQLYTSPDPFDAWDYLMTSDTKAASLASALFPGKESSESKTATDTATDVDDVAIPLAWLREAFFIQLIKKQIAQLDELLAAKATSLISIWEQYYAEAAVHFREDFICMLCLQRSKWEKDADTQNYFLKLTDLIYERRWVDTFPYYKAIADNISLDNKTRMAANITLAEIIIYYYPDPAEAELYISKADELVPGASPVKRARAQLFLKNKDLQSAKSILLDVVYNKPSDFMALIFAGDCFTVEESLRQAESWYLDALQKNALQTETYKRLINLYANPKWYAEQRSRIYNLLKRLEKREPFRYSNALINEGLATAGCFKNTELYHSYRDVAAGLYTNADTDESIKCYRQAIDLQPSLAVARIDLAYVYIAIEKFPEAKQCLDEALTTDSDSFDVHWALSYYFEKTSQKEEALASYGKCLALRPWWSDWIDNLIGNLYFSYKEFETAADYFRKAVAGNNNVIVYRQNLADALANAALDYEEKHTEADGDKAAAYYKEVAELSGIAEDWNKLGNFYFAKEEWQAAIENFSKAASINDKEPVYYGNIALAYEKLNNTEEAEAWYRKAIDADEATSGRYQNRLGLLYYYRNEFEKSIEQYKTALEREPENADYLNNICVAFKDLEQYEAGEPYYQRLLEKEPDNDMALNILGIICFRKGENEKSAEYYKRAIEKNSSEPVYFENLSLLYKNENRYDEAIQALESALALAPGNDTLWNNLGVMYYSLGSMTKAIESYSKAIRINNVNALYFDNIGLAYEKNNEMENAAKAYQQSTALL